MTTIDVAGRSIPLDEDGFVLDPSVWTPGAAAELARRDGISALGEAHWKIIDYLRAYYLENGIAPMIRKLVRDTGVPLKEIYVLFPSGPAKGACRVAGLPKPTGCV